MARKVTLKDRQRMIELWRAGDHSLEEIARLFGLSRSWVQKILAESGVNRGDAEKQIKAALTKAMENQLASDGEQLARLAIQQKEFSLKSVDWVSKKTMMIMRTAQEEKVNLANYYDELKSLNMAARTLSRNYATISKILKLDEEEDKGDNLPSFDINVMTDEMVERMRDEQAVEDEAIYGSELDGEELEIEEEDDAIEDVSGTEDGAEPGLL